MPHLTDPTVPDLAEPQPAEPGSISLRVRTSRSHFFENPANCENPASPMTVGQQPLEAQAQPDTFELSEVHLGERPHQDLDLGELTPLLEQPELTDIFVNGPEHIWYEAAGQLHRASLNFTDDSQVRDLATRLIVAAGGRLDDAYPAADVQTAAGARVHALLPPISRTGTLLSIRLQATAQPSLRQLHTGGMMIQELETFLRYLVRSRANFLVTGGTGSGKTTLLSALLAEVAPNERLILVEDTSELNPNHQHTVSLQAREPNAEGRGAVSLSDLIRQALRMRPTRLAVGECRGAEILDMLTAMNTGHAGSGSTVHANSAEAVPARLYAMGAFASLTPQAVALQAATAIDYIIHLTRTGSQRQVAGVYRLTSGNDQHMLAVEPICTQEPRRTGYYLFWHPGSEGLYQAAGLGRGK